MASKFIGRYKIIMLCFVAVCSCLANASAQQVYHLTINEAYRLARNNYPLSRQRELIKKTADYSVENASKGYLPSLSFNGQATYQSAVTNFPFKIPGIKIPAFSKDQYKIYGEVNQVIYDGGMIKNEKQTDEANAAIQQQNLEVELYALYDRVNQLFFGILLTNEQLKQNDLFEKDIQNGIDKTKALVSNGTAFRSNVDELQAQLLQADQSSIQILALRKSYINMLSLFINESVNDSTVLEEPQSPELSDSVNRPELLLYDYQKKVYDLQGNLLNIQLRPKFNIFFQGGYGRPGLNFLDNDFAFYYITGLRLNWNLGSLYTLKNQRHLLDINKKTIDIEKENFLFNTNITQKQQHAEITKYTDLIKKDDAIISLRESVKNATGAQLENGVLTAHDFLTQVIAEDQARQNRILNKIELLQSQYSYQVLTGNNQIDTVH